MKQRINYLFVILCLTHCVLLFPVCCFAQTDTTIQLQQSSIFEKITNEVKEYKIDTSDAPNDKTTKKIIELRQLKGGFNINEAIDYKIQEDKNKNETPVADLNKLEDYFKAGLGKKNLDNAVIWIYRNNFSYKELKDNVKFYKSSAGQKMADRFPIIMLESFTAAQILQENFMKQHKSQ